MTKIIRPNDLGKFLTLESCQRLDVNDLVRQAKKNLKKRLLEAHLEALGVKIELTTSKTRFGGERLWFVCPLCGERRGLLYVRPTDKLIGCRECVDLDYKEQRYKGMM